MGKADKPESQDAIELALLRSKQATAEHARVALALAATVGKARGVALLSHARQLPARSPEINEALGFAAFSLNQHALSREFYELVCRQVPTDALSWYNLASSERNLGNIEAAILACNRALHADGTLFQAAHLRSDLSKQNVGSNHIDELRKSLAANAQSLPATIFLNYALGKELDDLGDYDAAFAHFAAGAGARRSALDYSVTRDVAIMNRIIETFPGKEMGDRSPAVGRFGFIVGLPRSGTTLMERVLTNGPGVSSNGETDNFSNALLSSLPAQPGDLFSRAAAADPHLIERKYGVLAGDPQAQLVLEKLPLNFLYLGSIQKSLPSARILLVRRNMLDNCLGMFTTLFGTAYPFSYDLQEMADYAASFARLMSHWNDNSTGRILELSYDEFIEAPAVVGQRAFDHFALPWSESCLAVEANPKPSTTASAVQVRRPIYSSSVGRWRNYERHLGPLVSRLGDLGIDIDRRF